MRDVIVIGGGPGGYAAAIRASQLGGKVTVVEAADMGGTCVNRGCIPSKVWLRAVYLLSWIRRAEEFGIRATAEELDLATVVNRKNGVAGDIRMGMEGLLKNNGVEVIQGRARLKSPKEVDVEGVVHEARSIILATGSSLVVPDIPGLEDAAFTTNDVLDLSRVPSSVLVCGSGFIEIEMAVLLNAVGAKTYLAAETARPLPKEDGDTSQRIAQALREQGVEILPKFTLESVQKADTGFQAIGSGPDERTVNVERILVSARKPNTAGLGLDQAGVRLNDDGSVSVDPMLETSVRGVYAIGDVTGGWMLSASASTMGVYAAENAMGGSRSFPFDRVPRVLWTTPEVGAVGLSEEDADRKGIDVEVGDFPYSINGLAMARNETEGAVKIVSDARHGEILGVHIVGAGATELIGEAVLAMQLEATARELAYSMRPHPTFSESVVEAARDACQWALYLPKR